MATAVITIERKLPTTKHKHLVDMSKEDFELLVQNVNIAFKDKNDQEIPTSQVPITRNNLRIIKAICKQKVNKWLGVADDYLKLTHSDSSAISSEEMPEIIRKKLFELGNNQRVLRKFFAQGKVSSESFEEKNKELIRISDRLLQLLFAIKTLNKYLPKKPQALAQISSDISNPVHAPVPTSPQQILRM